MAAVESPSESLDDFVTCTSPTPAMGFRSTRPSASFSSLSRKNAPTHRFDKHHHKPAHYAPSDEHVPEATTSLLSDDLKDLNGDDGQERPNGPRSLPFGKLGLVGRDAEIAQITTIFQQQRGRSIIFISGSAGTGKTHLAVHALRPLVVAHNGFFLVGKHEQQQGNDRPYAAISSCCDDFCEQAIANLSSTQIYHLKTKLRQELGLEQGALLTSILPSLLPFVGATSKPEDLLANPEDTSATNLPQHQQKEQQQSSSDKSNDYFNAKLRFNTAFRQFMRVVCQLAPTVLLIDDLQWSDEASCQLLESLLKDFENTHPLLIVSTFRPDNITPDHLLVQFRQQIEQQPQAQQSPQNSNEKTVVQATTVQQPQQRINSHTINLESLDLEATTTMLIKLLNATPTSDVRSLAELVHHKTMGNAFFTVQFLTSLHERNFLRYHNSRWEWDPMETIREDTLATENVVDLVQAKMQSLPAELCSILPLMGSLGASFTLDLFHLVMNYVRWSSQQEKQKQKQQQQAKTVAIDSSSGENPTAATLVRLANTRQHSYSCVLQRDDDFRVLSACVAQGLLEKHGKRAYRWIHDKVEEGALGLIPTEQLLDMQYALALSLLEQMDPVQIDEHIFVLVYLLRSADSRLTSPHDFPRRRLIAKLRWKSGLKAFQGSAFVQAAVELQGAIRLLPPDSWEMDYKFCLDLYSTAAETHLCIGDLDRMKAYLAEILVRTEGEPLLDRKRAYNAMARGLLANGQAKETGELLLKVLAMLGIRFPKVAWKGTVLTVWKLSKIQKQAAKLTQKLATRPLVTDELQEWTLSLLAYLTFTYYYLHDRMWPLSVIKAFEYSLEVGISGVTPEIESMVALLCTAGLNDPRAGHIYASQAISLLDQVKSKSGEARSIFICHDFVFHFIIPIEESMKELVRGYYSGTRSGDSEFGCWCMVAYLDQCFVTGATKLDTLILHCREHTLEAREFQQQPSASIMSLVWQCALNLTGRANHSVILTGEAMSEEDWIATNSTISKMWNLHMHRYQIHIAFFMGDFERAVDLILEHKFDQKSYDKAYPGIFATGWMYFHAALSAMSLTRQPTGAKRNPKVYRKVAKKFAKQLKARSDRGSPNVNHQSSLVQAELAELSGKAHGTTSLFQAALSLTTQRGFGSDRGTVHERVGDFFLRRNESDLARHHYNEAMMAYSEWGAVAKVECLREQHQSLFDGVPVEIPCKTSNAGHSDPWSPRGHDPSDKDAWITDVT